MGAEPGQDDIALLAAWRGGDASAGSRLFERHYPAVARFFRTKAPDEALQDLVQKTFLACVEGRDRFRGEAAFRTYLLGIAYRLLYNFYAKRRRERARFDPSTISVHDLGPSPSEVVAARDEQRLVLAALRRIPLEHQAMLELFYWEGMTAAQAAAVVGVPVGTAKSRIRRARQLMRQELERIATTPALLESTLTSLDAWARGLRERL